MKDPVQFNLQGLDYKLEYLTNSYIAITEQILKTQEDIAAKIRSLDCTYGTVTNKDTANILSDIEKSKSLISQLRGFTGYKKK